MSSPQPLKEFDVLLIEDNWGDALLMREAFRDSGVKTQLHIVTDGEKALEFLGRAGSFTDAPRPDLILLDLNLPRMDGRTFLRRIREDTAGPGWRIVILTTSNLDTDIREVKEMGVNGYIVKPIDLEGFLKVTKDLGEFLMRSKSVDSIKEQF